MLFGQITIEDYFYIDSIPIWSGSKISVLLADPILYKPYWQDTTVYCKDGFWYLEGLLGYQLNGLFALAEDY